MFNAKLVQSVLGWWLIGTLVIITVVDAYALVMDAEAMTVSQWIYQNGRKAPVLYLILGVCIGHILFPLIVSNGH